MPQNQEVRLPNVVGQRLLEIADYQRPYAWEKKQLGDLWEDLDLMGANGTHYAGTIVLLPVRPAGGGVVRESMGDDGTSLQHCEVVDGQQRLITCFVLLDRVRRRLLDLERSGVELAGAVARKIRDTYGVVSVGNAQVPKLRLGSGLNDYWLDVVLGDQAHVGPPLVAAQKRLKQAAAFFDDQLAGLADGVDAHGQFDRLKDLQKRVTAGLGFLVYEVHSAAEVGVIFETLNERGRPLTELEKTKNYLLYLARSIPDDRGELLAQVINRSWSDVFTNLAGESGDMDDQLLRAHWLATEDPDTRAWKRIESVKRRFERSRYVSGVTRLVPQVQVAADQDEAWDKLFADVDSYVTSLRKCSFFLADMFDPSADFEAFHGDQEKVRRRSAALRRSGVVAIYRPLLFATRLRHPTDGALYADLVDACERYSARVFVIEQRRANAGEPRLVRLAHNLFSGADPEQVLSDVHAVLWRYAPDDSVRATLGRYAENWYRRRGHKYFLYEYERSLMSPREELPDLPYFTAATKEQRTTEHVLPQHPNDDARCWWDSFTVQEHAELVHSLGNLALTFDNSAYSNRCFVAKRGKPRVVGQEPVTCYAQGTLHQERALALHDEWTPDVIRARQRELAEWALRHWAVSAPSLQNLAEDDDETEREGTDDDEQALAPAGGSADLDGLCRVVEAAEIHDR